MSHQGLTGAQTPLRGAPAGRGRRRGWPRPRRPAGATGWTPRRSPRRRQGAAAHLRQSGKCASAQRIARQKARQAQRTVVGGRHGGLSAPASGAARQWRPSRGRPTWPWHCRPPPSASSMSATLRGGATARGASPAKRGAPAAAPPAVYVLDDELANSLLGAPPPPRAPRPAGEAAALDATQVRAAPPYSPAGALHARRCFALVTAALTAPLSRRLAAPLRPCLRPPLPRHRYVDLRRFCAALRRVRPQRCRRRCRASAAAAPPRPRARTARRRRARPTWAAGGRWRRRTRSARSERTPRDELRSCALPKKTLGRPTTTQTGAQVDAFTPWLRVSRAAARASALQ